MSDQPPSEWRILNPGKIEDGLRTEPTEVREAILAVIGELMKDPVAPQNVSAHRLQGAPGQLDPGVLIATLLVDGP